MTILAVTDDTFEREVNGSLLPVLVDFGTEWCAPCKQLAPILNEVADELADKVKVVKVNLDQDPAQAGRLGVRGIPSLFLFQGGKVIANRSGMVPKAALKDWILGTI